MDNFTLSKLFKDENGNSDGSFVRVNTFDGPIKQTSDDRRFFGSSFFGFIGANEDSVNEKIDKVVKQINKSKDKDKIKKEMDNFQTFAVVNKPPQDACKIYSFGADKLKSENEYRFSIGQFTGGYLFAFEFDLKERVKGEKIEEKIGKSTGSSHKIRLSFKYRQLTKNLHQKGSGFMSSRRMWFITDYDGSTQKFISEKTLWEKFHFSVRDFFNTQFFNTAYEFITKTVIKKGIEDAKNWFETHEKELSIGFPKSLYLLSLERMSKDIDEGLFLKEILINDAVTQNNGGSQVDRELKDTVVKQALTGNI